MTPPENAEELAKATEVTLAALADNMLPKLRAVLPQGSAGAAPRVEIARAAKQLVTETLQGSSLNLTLLDHRDLVTQLVNAYIASITSTNGSTNGQGDGQGQSTDLQPSAPPAAHPDPNRNSSRSSVDQAKLKIQPLVIERMDVSVAAKMARYDLQNDLTALVADVLAENKIQLNGAERQDLVTQILDDMLGLGPLEPLLADEGISEIMINGPKQIYIENRGKLTLSDVQFRDNAHVLGIATRIVTAIGRRIDESSPLCDARLLDGSRVNIIIPPLAIDGPTITIRKFSKKKITLETMVKFGSVSPEMAKFLRICGRCRLNILISGGTGSGKTTLLNALSQMIDHGERVVTIEDAAELQLQQPHVVRLETRPPNLEGHGEITMRDLLKNALRMRPDRIIVGETRGGEALDMLQAMNTGHDGSMSTVHANRPREALMRLENLVGMASANLSPRAIRQQIASAVDMIIQVSRMRDGSRRITYITEITGMEGEVITMQDLFTCEVTGEAPDGRLTTDFKYHGHRPHSLPKAAYFGLDKQVMEILSGLS